jgi:FixJ family two-component response regulator
VRPRLTENGAVDCLFKPFSDATLQEARCCLMNKQVAYELGISKITVKAHRGKVVEKMQARSFADLVNISGKLGSAPCSLSGLD